MYSSTDIVVNCSAHGRWQVPKKASLLLGYFCKIFQGRLTLEFLAYVIHTNAENDIGRKSELLV